MKNQSYMTRALKARDPRFARILGKIGYETEAMEASDDVSPTPTPIPTQPPAGIPADDLADLRKIYLEVVGKKPFNGWDAATLSAKIADHRAKA